MGGTDDPSNLVKLTIEEHAEAHKKLWETHGLWQDNIAWKALSGQLGKEKIIRQIQKNVNLGKKSSIETRKKISLKLSGKKQSPEWIENRRKKLIGQTRNFTDSWKKNISDSKKGQIPWIAGKKHSEESNEKNRISHLGNDYNKGRIHSLESRMNMSKSHIGNIPCNKGMKYEIVECPHCNKNGGSNSMKRYHFDNCKSRVL